LRSKAPRTAAPARKTNRNTVRGVPKKKVEPDPDKTVKKARFVRLTAF